MHDAGLGSQVGKLDGGRRRREIKHRIDRSKNIQRLVRHLNIQPADPGKLARILAKRLMACALNGAGNNAAIRGGDRLDEGLAHAAGGAGHGNAKGFHWICP
ncbi:hypothetical protein GCM10011587_29600 [Pyruvatibacter mobilis]|nr:hypothetical protein GCM10011587_29600 [Pyruvatibacter mobilis]